MKTGFLLNRISSSKRSGVVLLSVLLISVFLVSASTGFAIFARRTMRRFDREQRIFTARMVSEVAMDAAKLLLSKHNGKSHSAEDEFFVPRTFTFPDAGVSVTMRMEPLDDRIPLNNLFLPDGKTLRRELEVPWSALWQKVGAEQLENRVLDFLDEDTEPRLGGGERTGNLNRKLLSLEELSLVPGMKPETLSGFGGKPGVRALATIWSSGKINMNTAPAEVLSLLEGLDEKLAVEIVKNRTEKPLESISDLARIRGFPPDAVPKLMNIAAFKSDWFRVSFEVLFGDGEMIATRGILKKTSKSWNTVQWEEP